MNAWYHYLSLRALKSVNVITINQTQAKILGQKYKIPATPIYNSMDDSYPQNKPAIKENIVIWAANLKARKQPELFINLANDLKNTNYKFLMIGYLQNNTKFYQDLINQTQASNPNFKYLGGMPAEEVNKLLAKSKIFVNTCLPEGFGNNFIQAWFNECPTITLDFDPDDIIKNHKIGYHSGSYEQLVKDTRFLIENPSTTEEMSQRARLYALENHLPQKNMVKYEKFFEALIKK
ncbi:MAG: glycosyltransferase [Patescibacteria group bacterium]|jgi:glycosyltransferase involved in cell wall biosynthesis